MFGSEILDIIIGLFFVYLLLSLICTALNEYVASFTNRRGKVLVKGIHELLRDANAPDVAARFLSHRLIRGLYTKRMRGKEREPSYIPARTFAMTLLDVMEIRPDNAGKLDALQRPDGPSGESLRELLALLKTDATADVAQFLADPRTLMRTDLPEDVKVRLAGALAGARTEYHKLQDSIEVWFNNAMDRVSGTYKRYTQMMLIVVGLLVAGLSNADTIQIWRTLAAEDELRDGLVAQAMAVFPQAVSADSAAPGITRPPAAAAPVPPGDTARAQAQVLTAADSTWIRGIVRDYGDTSRVASREHAKMVYDSAMSALGRTELRFGWTWQDAALLGLARPAMRADSAADERKAMRRDSASVVARDSALFATLGGAERTDSIAARVRPEYGAWEAAPVGRWKWGAIFLKFLGLMMTAVAISFGAPFWFDTLNKIINVRGEGRAPDERPRSPGAAGKRLAEIPPK